MIGCNKKKNVQSLFRWLVNSVFQVFGQNASIQRLRRSKVVAQGVALVIFETSHRSHLKEK